MDMYTNPNSDRDESNDKERHSIRKKKHPLPKARISRYCHSKIDENSCQSFIEFINRYDQGTQLQIIKDALIPDIRD